MVTFKQAPLPFVGQKRQFLKHFEAVLDENIEGNGEDWTIIDVFGGSGLLSHTSKCKKSLARVIYNDFDGYAERPKHIKDINRLRQEIYQTVDGIVPKNKRLNKDLKAEIINKINCSSGYKDLNCLARLLFSGEQVSSLDELFKKDFWHCVRKATSYLDGVEVVSGLFHTLLPQYQHQEKTLFVLDPPYLCTHQAGYKQAHYFDLIDFLRLIHLTHPPYILFSSTKSEFIQSIDAMIED